MRAPKPPPSPDRPPFLAMPYPLDEYLDGLPGDWGKVARRLLRAAQWERGSSRCGRYVLDAGEALIDERSEKLWGGLVLDRGALPVEGRRALIRRVLERLERDGVAERRPARVSGPGSDPKKSPRNGPTPTVVRFMKFREILWPASDESAQETAQETARKPALTRGPIPPAVPPAPPKAAAPERTSAVDAEAMPRRLLEVVDEGGGAPGPDPWPRATSFRHALTLRMARTVLYPIGGHEPKIMASLQDSLGLMPEDDAVETCAARVVEAVQLRRRQPGTMAYFAQVLADEAVRRRALGAPAVAAAAPPPLPEPGCPEWARLRDVFRERVRADTFDRFHAPLTGRMDGTVLVLMAPDEYRRRFLQDNHREVFEGWARDLGVAESVRFETADIGQAAASGGA